MGNDNSIIRIGNSNPWKPTNDEAIVDPDMITLHYPGAKETPILLPQTRWHPRIFPLGRRIRPVLEAF